MPHAETLRMMRLMDAVRRRMGVTYPMEKDAARDEENAEKQQAENRDTAKFAENTGNKENNPGSIENDMDNMNSRTNISVQNVSEYAPQQPVSVDVSEIKLEEGDSPVIRATQEALEAAGVVPAEEVEAASDTASACGGNTEENISYEQSM